MKTHIVGIGASAGGLEAITQLIGGLKADAPCAYVVLQHLSPSYRSMMVEILARETTLSVREASQGDELRAGTIYVVPANFNALYKDGHLQLVTAPPEVVPKPSVNQFLISLASEEGDAAVGIVLSGTGSDGVAGLRAIQAAGGFTLVQKPETAKYDGMPRAAIEAGVVDHVLSPEEIAQRLPQLLEFPVHDGADLPEDILEGLISRLREKLQFDFSGYKVGTLMRRIRRREIATGNHDLTSYLTWVDANPAELDLLARDILISVTAFFRDREAFDVLRRAVLDICAIKSIGSEIRAWVAGCASGEEAYSIAMLLADALGDRLSQYRVQIFATDVDDDALNIGRRGVYPSASMSEVGADMIQRHFRPVSRGYEACKHLRDMIVFARHNLVSDPPFLRLDLVSCRNVLIYFDAPLQAKVLQTFHFGLNPEAYLFLGRSESVTQADSLFRPIDRRERLFRKSGESSLPAIEPAPGLVLRTPNQIRDRRLEALLSGLVQHFGVTAVLCDRDSKILHTSGQVDRFLQFPEGSARLGLPDVVASPLRGELLSLLHRATQTGKPQKGRRRKHEKSWLRISVEPLTEREGTLLLVVFSPEKPAAAEDPAPAQENSGAESELAVTREHLQTLVEEMATSNEEMQALNEEAQASNEELQATNEELEAANEELQATNEELVSLNEELGVKTTELVSLNEEYTHLYDALPFPILVFDRGEALLRFNGSAERRLDLRPTAIKLHVSRLRLPGPLSVLSQQLGCVLAHGDREESSIEMDGRSFRLAVVPGMSPAGDIVTLVCTLIDVTDITRTQADLLESQARLASLMEKTTVIFAMKDLAGSYIYANRRFLEYFAIDPAEYAGKTDFTHLPKKLAAEVWANDLDALRKGELIRADYRVADSAGNARYLSCVHQVLHDANGQPSAFVLEAEDVTLMRLAEEQLRITARVFDQAGEAIVVSDPEGMIQTVNAAFSRITGYTASEAIGRPTSILKSGRHSPDFYKLMWQALGNQGFWQGEIWNKRKDGEVYPEWLTINRIDDAGGRVEHYIAVFSDITQLKESQRMAEYLSTHDPLTGLPNRSLFNDRLKHDLALARRNERRLALLFIDLDNFKTINDTLGHDVGDELLKQVSERLREAVRDVDTIARLGGDEFTAILSDGDTAAAERVCRRIIDDLSASYSIAGHTLFAFASIGVAFYPDDGDDSASLTKAADAAMYRAKELGRNRFEFFKTDLQVRLLRRATIESALRAAMRQNELRLVFQPKCAIAQGNSVVGAEALVRWQSNELGNVPPADFIPVAEASGLITELDRLVARLLLDHMVAWAGRGLDLPTFAFNVSPRTIREADFIDRLVADCRERAIPSSWVQIEITEGALLDNSSQVTANLDLLHENGFKIAIDDFGTGYSSLGYLKRMPIDELKIDRSFVDGLGQDREDEAIALAVLSLARALGLTTVAEGVENQRQLAWLADHDCHLVQGYFLSRPLEAAAFEDVLARGLADDR